MTITVNLNVSFPDFGRNYYAQHLTNPAPAPLIKDERFDVFLIPAAERHFNNGVIGFNDQFRFLSDVLDAHLADEDGATAAWQQQPLAQHRSV